MLEGKQITRNHVWGRKKKTKPTKESEGRCRCYFSNAMRWFVRSFTFLEDNVKL